MNSDIRIKTDFFTHHKTIKLKRRLGAEGILSVIQLWTYIAKHRPEGDLTGMDDEDIVIAAGWEGKVPDFIDAICEIGFLDCPTDENPNFRVHDWEAHNRYASNAVTRSDRARFNSLGRWEPQRYKALLDAGAVAMDSEGVCLDANGNAIALQPHCNGNAPSLSPYLSPSPSPTEETREPSSDEEGMSDSQDESDELVEANKPEKESVEAGIGLKEVVDLWNQTLDTYGSSLPRVARVSGSSQRGKWVKARLREYPNTADWERCFTNAATSDFLNGKVKAWSANFDWVIRPNNFPKVLEGNYNVVTSTPLKKSGGFDLSERYAQSKAKLERMGINA